MDLRAVGDRCQHELTGMRGAIGDLRLETAGAKGGRGSIELGAVGGLFELGVRWARIWERE